MNLSTLLKIYSEKNCNKVYVKKLAANDNSKNQVYLGGSFDVLNILPIKEIVADNGEKGGGRETRFKTKLEFYWITHEGNLSKAPDAQLVLYPNYPEVRFSGFLKKCIDAPSKLMADRLPNRILFLGVSKSAEVIGFVVSPESQIANEFNTIENIEENGVFKVLTLIGSKIELDSKGVLLQELKRINSLGWINSKGFDKRGNIIPCVSTNCGGVTLETELGITANSRSIPDFLGWEIKQFGVSDFSKFGSRAITLMTPEPTGGFYVDKGIEAFIKTYGYVDRKGREARMNFGGVYKFGKIQKTTRLELFLEGYNSESEKIENSEGYLGLIDVNGNVVASWSYASLLKHWNTKHANACYVPSKKRKIDNGNYTQQYWYGNQIMLGSQTDFSIFLRQVALGNIYYDPGIKIEFAIEDIRSQNTKRRSQFRIKANSVTNLYRENEFVDLLII